jgi:hypothetical protein
MNSRRPSGHRGHFQRGTRCCGGCIRTASPAPYRCSRAGAEGIGAPRKRGLPPATLLINRNQITCLTERPSYAQMRRLFTLKMDKCQGSLFSPVGGWQAKVTLRSPGANLLGSDQLEQISDADYASAVGQKACDVVVAGLLVRDEDIDLPGLPDDGSCGDADLSVVRDNDS